MPPEAGPYQMPIFYFTRMLPEISSRFRTDRNQIAHVMVERRTRSLVMLTMPYGAICSSGPKYQYYGEA